MIITLRYFAWIRERIGKSDETLDVPAEIASVTDLIGWLKGRGPEYAAAFERAQVIRAAIDHTHVQHGARLAGAREVAFFPPVTGG